MKWRVAVVDDEKSVLDALKQGMELHPGFECVDCYTNAREALAGIPKVRTDVVLMDIRMPRMSGIECTRKLNAILPDLPVIILTGLLEHDVLIQSLMAGASGYLVKPVTARECVAAIVEVLEGGAPLSKEVARMLIQSFRGVAVQWDKQEPLSARQSEIMALLFQGYRAREIAERLGVGVATVQTHLHRMFDKIGARNRAEAVTKYLGSSDHRSRA
jgi:DNA-binding NarL/FixJ family response regulator